jgi:hypothetical protein
MLNIRIVNCHKIAFITLNYFFLIFTPVKCFFIIYSFYILALSCMPCPDVAIKENHEKAHISASTEDHCHLADFCSPFCTCSCCCTTAIYQPITSIILPESYSTSIKISTQVTLFSYNSHTIWQPPQLV